MGFNRAGSVADFNVIEDYGDLGEGMKLTFTSWFKKPAKYDLRKWENAGCGKGITLEGEELEGLYQIIKKAPFHKSTPKSIAEGATVYVVDKGDVEEYVVANSFKVKGGKRWNLDGYRNGKVYTHDIIWDSDLNKNVFLSKSEAYEKAKLYLENHEHINPAFILENATEKVAYKYKRKCDDYTLGSGYCVYDGYIYGFDWYTYTFIRKFSNEKEKNKIIKDMNFKREYNTPKDIAIEECEFNEDFMNECNKKIKTLYPCKADSDWDYTEGSCSHCIDHEFGF